MKSVYLLMEIRGNAKASKYWATSDLIRNKMAELGFDIKDTKNGVEWKLRCPHPTNTPEARLTESRLRFMFH